MLVSRFSGMVMNEGSVTSNSVNLANCQTALNRLRAQLNASRYNNFNVSATPMIGRDDTGNIFTASDMKNYLD
jgi:hypothetical protein